MSQLIQSGESNKTNTGKHVIPFQRPYAVPPTVVISPYFRGEGRQVANVITIDEITQEDFTVVGESSGANYFVSWIAVGRGL